ncbi:hypothetical protein PAXINDRAFT_169494 [Paxillus involutus ATCC 200175]|uniref:Uncharacterized protein n=1 Tax=Paxillus involutus ATCC 200175 TaxID=664439 RepID=A0A0C9TX05_PAXIN|nr:hypothetical protein PAXINDRAFT_169494 [Paxillus involutus ATCC 200175]
MYDSVPPRPSAHKSPPYYESYPNANSHSSMPRNYETTPLFTRETVKKLPVGVIVAIGFVLMVFADYSIRTLTRPTCYDPFDQDERYRLNMVWVDVEPHGCISYSTREYTARLANVPSDYNRRVEACKATPLVVHGQSYLPHTCEDNGPDSVIATWHVNQSQPDCVTFWTDYKDKGCTSVGSRKRRIEHRLENLPSGGDWREFSATTPVRFGDMHFSGAQEAFQSDRGVYGLWEIDDNKC